jgi:hypothetical protein
MHHGGMIAVTLTIIYNVEVAMTLTRINAAWWRGAVTLTVS